MHFCRPPGGDYDKQVVKAATEQGLTTVLWTDDPGDYASPGTHVIESKTLTRLSNGGIILLHDGIQQTLDVLPQIIHFAKDHGYRFVTVDELMNSLVPNLRYNPVRPVSVPLPDRTLGGTVPALTRSVDHPATPSKSTIDFVKKPSA